MYQKSQVLPPNLPHHQKMIFEMELRGYSQHTKDHYLGHLRLLEKHTNLSLIHISEPTRLGMISYAVFCLKKKKKKKQQTKKNGKKKERKKKRRRKKEKK